MPLPFDMQDRLPVWTALSELFLDTSFDEADHERIAAALRRTRYNRAEIDRILREEVSPAFSANLFSIAGEWVQWSDEEVQTIMLRWHHRQDRLGWLGRVKAWLTPRVIPSDWTVIAAKLE